MKKLYLKIILNKTTKKDKKTNEVKEETVEDNSKILKKNCLEQWLKWKTKEEV